MSQTTTTDDTNDSTAFRTITTAGAWSAFLDRVAAMTATKQGRGECRLHADADGLHVRAVDAPNVGMVDVTWHREAFESFDAPDGGCEVGLPIDRMEGAIGVAGAGELVTVGYDTADGRFDVTGEDYDFDIAGIDPENIRAEPDIPDLDLPASITLAPDAFGRAITAADTIADHLRIAFALDGDTFRVSARGDTDEVAFAWDADDASVEDVTLPSREVSSLFSLTFLEDIRTAMGNEPVTITFGDEFPVQIRQPLDDDAGDCLYMIAPRIESE